MKKFRVVLLCAVMSMMLFMSGFSFASITVEKPKPYTPMRMSYISSFTTAILMDGTGKAVCNANLISMGSDKIKVVMYLQQYTNGSWKNIKSWNQTQSGNFLAISGSYAVNVSNSYRVKAYGYVYIGTQIVESAIKISE